MLFLCSHLIFLIKNVVLFYMNNMLSHRLFFYNYYSPSKKSSPQTELDIIFQRVASKLNEYIVRFFSNWFPRQENYLMKRSYKTSLSQHIWVLPVVKEMSPETISYLAQVKVFFFVLIAAQVKVCRKVFMIFETVSNNLYSSYQPTISLMWDWSHSSTMPS